MGQEQASFEGFVVARSPGLLRYAYVLCGDSAFAEDLVQEGLLKAHRHWNRISALDGPEPYVKRIIANHFVSSRRRRSASEQVSDSIEFAAGSENSDEVVDREVLWSPCGSYRRGSGRCSCSDSTRAVATTRSA